MQTREHREEGGERQRENNRPCVEEEGPRQQQQQQEQQQQQQQQQQEQHALGPISVFDPSNLHGDTWGTVAACCLLLDFQLALRDCLHDAGVPAVQIAIADDLTVVGPPASIQVAWDFIAAWAPASGLAPEPYALKVKTPKCKLFSFASQRTLEAWFSGTIPDGVERVSALRRDGGVRFLGSPVGHAEYCSDFCYQLVEVDR